jgi:hypothetical protein
VQGVHDDIVARTAAPQLDLAQALRGAAAAILRGGGPTMRSPLDPCFVLPWYEFRELQALAPRDKARLVEDAAERVTTQPPMLWAWGLTLGVLAALAFVYLQPLRDAPFLFVLGGALLAFVPLLAVRRALVHRTALRLLAAQRAAT